ncbi:MAG TPA: cation-translocating P-type ATPase [Aggregatilinea sp.]|jgi:Ca2+-transporting ATPase|uniref:cation-translocating P-type ATPase n=1 Tax=Aggregatilinea sp. TaxID=2806333 RepID=UPI002D0C230C|nr:cation-translocating P-type ATPase [Aggregatilinea sp.]HML21288.1 cation-translocating P-type ATPase [Aggregatilinea sp.]
MSEKIEERWYALPVEQALERLGTTADSGLSDGQVAERQAEHGKNALPVGQGTSIWKLLLSQFTDVMVFVLIVAAAISFAIGDTKDSIVILAIVVLNAALGFFQEYQAEQALAALSAMQTPQVRVRRGGHVHEVSAEDLVPGDIVLLEAGDRIPADGRLIEAVNLQIEEAALTGESVASEKSVKPLHDNGTPPAVADRTNMAYMGTAVTYGRGVLAVTETGLKTQLGNIAAMLQRVEEGRTPLQDRLAHMSVWLAGAALIVTVLVFVAGVLRGEDLREMFLTAIGLAVAAIPEGLPAVITIALALGARRMVKRNALIRKLPAVETLGSVSVICTDKTGTLTRNEMTVTTIALPGRDEEVRVSGVGYQPVGNFHVGEQQINAVNDEVLARILKAAALNTDAYVEQAEEDAPWSVVGDTTEGALLVAAEKAGWDRGALEKDLPRVAELPFSSERKAMTTIHQPTGRFAADLFEHAQYVSFTKGAPDQLVRWASEEVTPNGPSPLTPERSEAWSKQIERMASEGLRVIGIGYRPLQAVPEELEPEKAERDLTLLGLIGILDPPRSEARRAVKVAAEAGIRTVMITGDHKLTAVAIGKQLGIMGDEGRAMTGADLDAMSDDDLKKVVNDVSVYARVSPEHKLRVVKALQSHGQIVAMTGDGVNDAPALKQANIGVAMGITGTDVSQGASDMILTDDNFASIVAAVEEGRTIYDNIRKFIRYLLSTNAGEIIAMFAALVFGLRVPLLAIQILWINLVTDGLPAIALGFEPSEPNVMKRKPRPPRENIFAHGVGLHVIWVGIWLGAVTLLGYVWAIHHNGGDLLDPSESVLAVARTMAFSILALSQVFEVSAIHGGDASFFRVPLHRNKLLWAAVVLTAVLQMVAVYAPFANDILNTVQLDATELLVAWLLAGSIFPAVEIEKVLRRRYYSTHSQT